MENRNIFWGILLVAIGGLFILDNMDLINFSFSALVGLWPLLLVIWGISLLPFKAVYKTILGLAIAVFALVYASTSDKTFWWEDLQKFEHNVHFDDDEDNTEDTFYTFKFDEEMDSDITEATLSMDVAAGKFRLEEPTNDHIIDFEAYSNIGPYTSNMVTNGNRADISIGIDDAVIKKGTNRNRATIKLNPKVEWEIQLDVGAADLRADLRKFMIKNIDIDGGASSIKIKIGDLQQVTNVKLDAGAASIKIEIPRDAGCRVESESFLVDLDLDGFVKDEEGNYYTPGFNESKQKVYIDIDAAISQLDVRRY